jgi:hypothetical protein
MDETPSAAPTGARDPAPPEALEDGPDGPSPTLEEAGGRQEGSYGQGDYSPAAQRSRFRAAQTPAPRGAPSEAPAATSPGEARRP